jgi:outer membrane protein assembly factor BamB
MRTASVLLTLLMAVRCTAAGSDWPQWRGPNLDGHSSETNIPLKWSTGENIAWKVSIGGRGHSSPIVVGDRIFLTTCMEEQKTRVLLCLDRHDGHLLWMRDVLVAPLEKKNSLNNFASSTPASDGKRVFVAFLEFPNLRVYCFDLDGNKVWEKSPGKFKSMHGWGSSPILYKDMVIFNGDQDAEAYIVALRTATGEEVYRIDRLNRTRSYCNALIVDTPKAEGGTKTQMVLTGSKSVASYDPNNGRQWWVVDGPTEQFVASPVYTDGAFFITGGFPQMRMMGIDAASAGNVTGTKSILWYDPHSGAYVPSPIADGQYVFTVSDEGRCTCLEARTGKRMWSEQIGKHFRPSPVWAEGRLYFLADNGTMTVLKSGPAFEMLAKNELGEDCYASPAISNGQIFLRTVGSLYCIGK